MDKKDKSYTEEECLNALNETKGDSFIYATSSSSPLSTSLPETAALLISLPVNTLPETDKKTVDVIADNLFEVSVAIDQATTVAKFQQDTDSSSPVAPEFIRAKYSLKIGRKDLFCTSERHSTRESECLTIAPKAMYTLRKLIDDIDNSEKVNNVNAAADNVVEVDPKGDVREVSPKAGSSGTCFEGIRDRHGRHLAEKLSTAQSVSKSNSHFNTVDYNTRSLNCHELEPQHNAVLNPRSAKLNSEWNRLFSRKKQEMIRNHANITSEDETKKVKVSEKVKMFEDKNEKKKNAELQKIDWSENNLNQNQKSTKKIPKLRKIAVKNSPKILKIRKPKSKLNKEVQNRKEKVDLDKIFDKIRKNRQKMRRKMSILYQIKIKYQVMKRSHQVIKKSCQYIEKSRQYIEMHHSSEKLS